MKNIRCKVTKISQTEGKKMSFLFRGAIIKTKSKLRKLREEQTCLLFRSEAASAKPKLSDMAKFILTYPVAAKVERRENVFSFPRCSSVGKAKCSCWGHEHRWIKCNVANNFGVSQIYEEKLKWQNILPQMLKNLLFSEFFLYIYTCSTIQDPQKKTKTPLR